MNELKTKDSYIFYDQVAKTDWQNLANNNASAVAFKNLLTVVPMQQIDKLTNNEVAWVADAVLQQVANANGNSSVNEIDTAKNFINQLKTDGSYIFYGEVKKNKTADTVGWLDWVTDANKAIVFKNLLSAAKANNFEKLTSGESITVPYEIWSALDGADDIAKQNKIIQLANGGNIIFAAAGANSSLGENIANNSIGFILAPQIAIEYDNGMLHVDLNFKYLHRFNNVTYKGNNGGLDRTQLAGPMALFVGLGFGLNF